MSQNRTIPPPLADLEDLISAALREDGDGVDVTSDLTVPSDAIDECVLLAREPGVFAGRAVLEAFALRFADEGLGVEVHVADGQAVGAGQALAALSGPARTILRIERPLLNFLQRLCGIATMTRQFVEAVAGTSATILDTRKTVPGFRALDKYAVRCGGGANHRMGLHDAVLVKDNHLAGVPVGQLRGFVSDLVARAKQHDPKPAFVEVEVDAIDQLREVLAAEGVDRVLLDNFSADEMRQAVALRNATPGEPVRLEASGRVDLGNVRAIAETGVDFISVGALTHSVQALDLAIESQSS